jgi:hypothetical protein
MVETLDRRRRSRLTSVNLLSFVCFDERGNAVHQGMGRTINVSEDGILLETHDPLEDSRTVELTIGLRDDLVDIRGAVIYTIIDKERKVRTGIQFVNVDEAASAVLEKFIKAFKEEEGEGGHGALRV